MQLTRFTDYGLRIMLFLNHTQENHKIPLSVLSEQLNMNHNHVNKVSQKLAAMGWINSTRGKNGGISLAPEARLLHIGKIVLALEPQLEPIDCRGVECPLSGNCRLQGVLAEAAQAFMDVLLKYRLEDVTEQDLALIKMPGMKEACNSLLVLNE